MKETHINKHPNNFDDEINLLELSNVLWDGKWIIVSVTAFVSMIGVIYSLLLPNIYESKAILAPVNASSGISGALGSYSNLAGLAGINLPTQSDGNNSVKAIKKIGSLSFFESEIMTNIFLPDLLAVKSWNSSTNTFAYDENIYDTNSNTWIRDYSYPKKQIPSAQEGFAVFKSKQSINVDKNTGFVTLTIKHKSPFLAKQWIELVVNQINSFYRQKDKLESEKSISYLKQQFAMTGLSEIKQVLAQLIQEETKKLTLIEANQFYVFDYIDPPAVMEQKSEPSRALICIISALLGGILSIVLVLIRHYVFSEKST